jgi:hypothetical protein
MARGAIRIGLEYEYELDPAKKLSDYNMEAQGDLLADYWALKFAAAAPGVDALYQDMLHRRCTNRCCRASWPTPPTRATCLDARGCPAAAAAGHCCRCLRHVARG